MSLPRTSPFTYSAVLAEELEIAGGIWSSMLDRGLSPPKMLCVDLEFTSNSDESLENLATFLRKRGYELCPPRRRRLIPHECNRHIEGKTNGMRIDEDCLMVWVAEMVRLADAFHCQFGDWGAFFDPNSASAWSPRVEDSAPVFRKGVEYFDNDDLTAAYSSFLASAELSAGFADGYDGMGTVAMDLGLLNLALRNYDRAVELQPDEPGYRLNRGACRDYRRDFRGALEDYAHLIAKQPHCPTAFLNRGNTYHNMGESGLACADWRRAMELGCEEATRALERHYTFPR